MTEKKELVRDLIIRVLKENENGYMNVADIAEKAFGEAYNVYTNKYLEDRIKRSIDRALGKLAGEGYIPISLKNDKEKSKPIDRWKIATDLDEKEVKETLQRKVTRADGFSKATTQLKENAIEKGLLPNVEQLKLK